MCRLTAVAIVVAIAGLLLAGSAGAVGAVTTLVAPEAVRELLQRHLPLAAADDEAAENGAGADAVLRATRERRLRKEAGELLATAGYFSPRIELREDATGSVLTVDPGPQATVAHVAIDWRGAIAVERRQQLEAAWALPTGAVFTQAAWDEAKQSLLRELLDVDFAGARLLSSRAEVDVAGARVDLQLVYDAGARVRYGALSVVGLHRYTPELVERYCARLRAGLPYRQDDMLGVQTALQNTPYFASVSVDLAPAPAADGVAGEGGDGKEEEGDGGEERSAELVRPVVVTLRERAPYSIAFGAGVSSNTGARVEASLRDADLFNRAWELSSGIRLEQLRQVAYADVFLPPDGERRDSLGAVVEQSDIEGLALERTAFAVARSERFAAVEQRLGVSWQSERQLPQGGELSINRALTATAGWVWRYAEDPRDAAEGIVAQLQLGAASKALASEQNFLRSYLRYSQGIPLANGDSVLLRGEVGYTAAPSRKGIPQDYLFRTGGSNSVRGYDYLSLGVKEDSATLGGRYLLVVSGEYTHWFAPPWGIAGFVDAGQAGDDRDVFSLALGYGLGARWKSPAGPLAVDLAWGQRDQALHLHFSLAVPF